MKLNVALAAVAAIAIDAATASTCTKSDLEFLTMSPGTDCTFRPASVAYLAAIDPSLSLTTLAGGLDTATDTIQKSAVVLGYCNAFVAGVVGGSSPNCTDQVLNTPTWQAVQHAADLGDLDSQGAVAAINGTRLLVIANVTCIAIKQTMGALLPCFSKNCTAVALSFCNGNPNAMASSTTVGQIATAAFGALTKACGAILTAGASDDTATKQLFAGLFPHYNAQTYSVNCSTLLDPSQFGTFTYNTSTPTKPSSASTASIGVATLASVVAAAFAF